MKKKMLSIVIPCYNEHARISKHLYKVEAYMNDLIKEPEMTHIIDSYQIIVINDGSIDSTANEIVATKINELIPVINDKNNGKGYVIREGFQMAQGEFIMFMDADLAVDISGIKKALLVLADNPYSAVIGSRKNKQTQCDDTPKWYREIMS